MGMEGLLLSLVSVIPLSHRDGRALWDDDLQLGAGGLLALSTQLLGVGETTGEVLGILRGG